MTSYIQSNQVVNLGAPLLALLTNKIHKADSGKIFILGVQTAIQTFVLPLPEPGMRYKIICDAVIGFDVIIASNPAGIIYGNLTNVSTAAITTTITGAGLGAWPIVVAAKVGANIITIKAAARAGDYVELVSDGAYWYVHGMSTDCLCIRCNLSGYSCFSWFKLNYLQY